ncbi:hypothetical protein C4D60_Mb08t02420 [Musa balbisiana]|uniref:PWWP domain-containing protein n=1 Tax=Musa balbisiana TaxID=52838 RepID=A0A4S8K0S6_MUSBA|nr:hypothetical protein C4D60_Mb08t02420 [Musa balbisiana]
MTSNSAMEDIGGLDLNVAGDAGEDGNGGCLAGTGDGDSIPREAGNAPSGDRDAMMNTAEDTIVADTGGRGLEIPRGGNETGLQIIGCSGAAEVGEEMQNDAKDEGSNSCLGHGFKGDQNPESNVVEETGNSTAEVETVPDKFEPAKSVKTSNEVESTKKFESSFVEKPNSENDLMTRNLVESVIPATEDEADESRLVAEDESGGHVRKRSEVMETQIVIESAKTMDALDLNKVEGVKDLFIDINANVGGEKDNRLKNENGVVLVEEDLSHEEKEQTTSNAAICCVSVGGHILSEDDSRCSHDLSVGAEHAECAAENVATLASAAFDVDKFKRLVDASDPGAIQVEVSESSNQTAARKGHSSCTYKKFIVVGWLQPEKGTVDCVSGERQKRSCDIEMSEAVFVNVGCLSESKSSMNQTGVEADILEGVADQGNVKGGSVEISDKSEPTRCGVSCLENVSHVTKHDFVDGHIDATEIGLGSDALDAGCAMMAAEADPPVAFVKVDTESLEGTPDGGRAQVDVIEMSSGINLPGHSLSIAKQNKSFPNEVVNHTVADSHLHATEGLLGPGTTDQNEAMILKSSVITSERVDVLTLEVNQDKESQELDGKTVVGDLSMLDNDQGSSSVLELPLVPGESSANACPDVDANYDQEMVVDEQENSKGTDKQTVKHAAARPEISIKEKDQHALYHVPYKVEDGFSTSDLVWGKVKSHPWWPGQICDPSDASDLALKYQKKDNFLVAYFGDKTFAWCDVSQLKHFETFFSQMEKQSSSDVFVGAVQGALDELSRRIGLGMTCFCFPQAANAGISYQKVENSGIREGSNGYTLDRSAILSYFQPGRLLGYVKTLAKFSSGRTNKLELVRANAQLNAFYRSKGYPKLSSFQFDDDLTESCTDIPQSKSDRIYEVTIEQLNPTLSDLVYGKRKSRERGSYFNKQKHILEDGKKQKSLSELMEAEYCQFANGAKIESGMRDVESVPMSSSKKHKVTDSDSSDSGSGKKKRLDSLGDLEIKQPSPAISSSFKIGECIRRVASQLTGSSPILKSHNETSMKNVSKNDNIFDMFVSDGFSHNIKQSPKLRIDISEDFSSPDEMLSQLRIVGRNPIKGYSFLSTIISFFTEFRDYYVSSSACQKKHPEKSGGRRGRKRKVDIQSAFSEMAEFDHMQDSYWSDLVSYDSPAKSKEAHPRSQRKRRGTSGKTSTPTLVSILQGTEHLQVGTVSPNVRQAPPTDRSVISIEEKIVEECTPTALILNFSGSKSLPSETDLIRVFSRYGPLKEAATEVQRRNNRVKVVFKRRADAEIAFSSAGKYSIFGPSLLSYRLRYLPSTPDTSPATKLPDKRDSILVESSNLDIPDNLHSSISSASNTNLQDKSDATLTGSSNTKQAETERVIVLDTMQVRSEALTAKVGEVDEQAG